MCLLLFVNVVLLLFMFLFILCKCFLTRFFFFCVNVFSRVVRSSVLCVFLVLVFMSVVLLLILCDDLIFFNLIFFKVVFFFVVFLSKDNSVSFFFVFFCFLKFFIFVFVFVLFVCCFGLMFGNGFVSIFICKIFGVGLIGWLFFVFMFFICIALYIVVFTIFLKIVCRRFNYSYLFSVMNYWLLLLFCCFLFVIVIWFCVLNFNFEWNLFLNFFSSFIAFASSRFVFVGLFVCVMKLVMYCVNLFLL